MHVLNMCTACNQTPLLLIFLTDGVHIWYNHSLWCVDCNTFPDQCYDFGIKDQGHILKNCSQLVTRIPLLFFDRCRS